MEKTLLSWDYMSNEKPQKNKGGRPGLYKEPKQTISLSVTRSAVQYLDELAEERGLSRSELVEQIGRGIISLTEPNPEDIEVVAFSLWELNQLGDILVLQQALLGEELMQRGLFKDRPISEERAEVVEYLLEYIDKLLKKICPPSRTLFDFREVHPPVSAADITAMTAALQALTNKLSTEAVESFDNFNRLYVRRLPWREDSFVRASFGEIQQEVQAILEQIKWQNCHEHIRRSINKLTAKAVAKKALWYILSCIDDSDMCRSQGFEAQQPFMNLIRWLSSSEDRPSPDLPGESCLEVAKRLSSKYSTAV
jgi:hypothetical protein